MSQRNVIRVTRNFCDDRSIDTQQRDDGDDDEDKNDEDIFVVLDFNQRNNEIPQTPTDDRENDIAPRFPTDHGSEGSTTEKREIHILIHKDTDYDENGYGRPDTDKLSVDTHSHTTHIMTRQSLTKSVLSIRNNHHNQHNKKCISIPISPITLPSNDTDNTNTMTQIANTPLPSPGSLTSLNLNAHSNTARFHKDKNWNLNLSLKHININMIESDPDHVSDTNVNVSDVEDEDMKTTIVSYIFNGVQFSQDMLSVELPIDIEQSKILLQYPNDIIMQSIALYRKYIQSDSDLEINIPYAVRETVAEKIELLIEKKELNKDNGNDDSGDDDKENNGSDDGEDLDTLNEGDLYLLFDESCVSILRLLVASFKRFKTSKGFEEYLNETNKNGLNGGTVLLDIPSGVGVGYTQYKPSVYDGNMYNQILAKYSV